MPRMHADDTNNDEMKKDFKPQTKPVIQPMPEIPIPVGDVLKRLGYPSVHHELTEGIQALLHEAMDRAKQLMQLTTVYRILRIQSNDMETVRFLDDRFIIQSRLVAKLLGRCRFAVCLAATAGIALDREVSSEMEKGEITGGYMLDAIGSETVEAAVDALHWNLLQSEAEKFGMKVTPRFSPGYGDWPLTVQKAMIEVSGGGLIGISVTPSFLMIPRKSVSAVLGLESA